MADGQLRFQGGNDVNAASSFFLNVVPFIQDEFDCWDCANSPDSSDCTTQGILSGTGAPVAMAAVS